MKQQKTSKRRQTETDYSIITGASRGIGREIALKLASKGKNLILIAKEDERGLSETAALISNVDVLTFLCDVSDPLSVDEIFKKLEGITVDILVNNAGKAHFSLVQDTSDEDWNDVISTNLSSAFYMTKRVVPQMVRNKKGTIVYISSYWGSRGSAMESAYCAAKGGLNAFAKSMEEELSPSNIKVILYEAEFVDTSMNSHLSKQEAEEAAKLMPSGRIYSPSEVAEVVTKNL